MQEVGINARPRGAIRCTTDSRFTKGVASNLLDRNCVVTTSAFKVASSSISTTRATCSQIRLLAVACDKPGTLGSKTEKDTSTTSGTASAAVPAPSSTKALAARRADERGDPPPGEDPGAVHDALRDDKFDALCGDRPMHRYLHCELQSALLPSGVRRHAQVLSVFARESFRMRRRWLAHPEGGRLRSRAGACGDLRDGSHETALGNTQSINVSRSASLKDKPDDNRASSPLECLTRSGFRTQRERCRLPPGPSTEPHPRRPPRRASH